MDYLPNTRCLVNGHLVLRVPDLTFGPGVVTFAERCGRVSSEV